MEKDGKESPEDELNCIRRFLDFMAMALRELQKRWACVCTRKTLKNQKNCQLVCGRLSVFPALSSQSPKSSIPFSRVFNTTQELNFCTENKYNRLSKIYMILFYLLYYYNTILNGEDTISILS